MKLPSVLLLFAISFTMAARGHAGLFETATGSRLRAREIIAARRLLVGCRAYLDRQIIRQERGNLDYAGGILLRGWTIDNERSRELIWWRKALAGSASVLRGALAPEDVGRIGIGLTELAHFFRRDTFGPDSRKHRRALRDLQFLARRVRAHLAHLLRRPIFRSSPTVDDEGAASQASSSQPDGEPDYVDLGKDEPQGDEKPAETPPAPKAAHDMTHRVVWGDTLSEIIVDAFHEAGLTSDIPLYGQGSLVERVAAANAIDDPNLIYPGQSITIPAVLLTQEEPMARERAFPTEDFFDQRRPAQDVDLVFAL